MSQQDCSKAPRHGSDCLKVLALKASDFRVNIIRVRFMQLLSAQPVAGRMKELDAVIVEAMLVSRYESQEVLVHVEGYPS